MVGYGYLADAKEGGLCLSGRAAVNARWNQRAEARNFMSVGDLPRFITLSFKIYSTSAINLRWSPRSPKNRDDWKTVHSYGDFDLGFVPANEWTKIAKTIPLDIKKAKKGFGGDISIKETFTGDATFSNLKLELNDVATPFIPDDPATNLAKCQRYYFRHELSFSSVLYAAPLGDARYQVLVIEFPVSMRAQPTTDWTLSGSGVDSIRPIGNPTKTGYHLQWNNVPSGAYAGISKLTIDAEL